MNRRSRGLVLLVLGLTLGSAAIEAQNPAVDLPHRRVGLDVPAAEFVTRGLDRLDAGAAWDAMREFREALRDDATRPLASLGLAIASRAHPRRANGFAWDAFRWRKESADRDERARRVIEVYAAYFAAERAPNPADATLDEPPAAARKDALCTALTALAESDPLAARLLAFETRALERAPPSLDALIRRSAERLERDAAMPFELPGYGDALAAAFARADAAGRARLARWPRHPHFAPLDRPTPVAVEPDPIAWQPRAAPGYELPRGLGGTDSLADHRGKATLVVFFLGFGCVHCIEQLHELAPRDADFRAAGIEIVAIGTDTVDEVKASYQMARENGDAPLPFTMLCDPDAASFRTWRAFDEFEQKPLHGTFLVDPEGRVLWQDISVEPFMATEFLLGECRRLLAAWR